jgi:hypothetical protein
LSDQVKKTKPHVTYKDQHGAESTEPFESLRVFDKIYDTERKSKSAKPQNDKTPCPSYRETGFCLCAMKGLRVSRLLDHRAVSGSKSDTPNRAKNLKGMILKTSGNVKGFR